MRGSFEEGLEDAPQNEVYTRTMKSVTTEMQRHPLSKQGTFLPLIMGKHPFFGRSNHQFAIFYADRDYGRR